MRTSYAMLFSLPEHVIHKQRYSGSGRNPVCLCSRTCSITTRVHHCTLMVMVLEKVGP